MIFEYAPARTDPGLANLRPRYGLFIDGDYRDAAALSRTVDPATGEVLAEVAMGGSADVDAAVDAARRALHGPWGQSPGADRARYLYRISRLISENAPSLATVETLDTGQPIRESLERELPLVAQQFFHYAGWADKLRFAAGPGAACRPAGVTALVLSGGYPLLALAWKAAPALACGNPVIIRPASDTPLAALAFADLCRRAGLPAGAVNVVPGDDDTARLLAGHPGVDVVAFVGPTEAGRAIVRATLDGRPLAPTSDDAAGPRARVTLRSLAPVCNVVFEDAPVDEAVDGVADGLVRRIGYPATRLLVQEPIAEQFLAALRERLSRMRVGDPLDANTDVGPLPSPAWLARVRNAVAAGEAEGAHRWTAGFEESERGLWAAPTVFSEVSPSHRIGRGDHGGPVLAVLTFRTPAEAIDKANTLQPSAVAVGIWAGQGTRTLAVAQRLRTDTAWINTTGCFEPATTCLGDHTIGCVRASGYHGLEVFLD